METVECPSTLGYQVYIAPLRKQAQSTSEPASGLRAAILSSMNSSNKSIAPTRGTPN